MEAPGAVRGFVTTFIEALLTLVFVRLAFRMVLKLLGGRMLSQRSA
jgi:hypothetical protein